MTVNTPTDPIDGVTEWTNEDTGVKYQFISGAWRAVGSKAVEDLLSQIQGAAIYYGDYEPIVDAYELWYDTTRLELFVNYEGMWFPAAAGSGGGTQDLQEVLEQGSVANKGFLLTNAENDAILVSPEEGRVMLGGFGDGVVPAYELRHTNSTQDSAVVKLELDEDGERFDIECDEKVNNIHFRFENESKLDINKKGDAVFEGKVRVQPGTTENEVVTYQQLQELEEEIEDIRPSLERGRWTFATNMAPGQYNIYLNHTDQYCSTKLAECIAEADDPTEASDCQREYTACLEKGDIPIEEWTGTKIWVNQLDLDSTFHQWDTIEPGEKLEIVNEDGSGFALYEVDDGDITSSGGRIGIPVIHERSNGAPSGAAKIKLFTLSDANGADFVRKDGDTMTGKLILKPTNSTNSLAVYSKDDADSNQYSIYNYGKLYTPENGSPTRDVIFYTTVGGDIGGGLSYEPSKSYHLANKRYVDKRVNIPTSAGWKVTTEDTSSPLSGAAHFDGTSMYSSTVARINFSSRIGYLELYDWTDNKTIYSNSSGNHFMLSAYYTGSDVDNKWKHKGFANITKIETYNRNDTWYFLVTFGTTKIANGGFKNGQTYYLTIPGLF